MTRILLIRHGNTDLVNLMLCGRLPGIPLNGEGLSQARAVGRRLAADMPLIAVHSSPLERAAQTAEIIAGLQSSSPRVTIDERLTEMDFGRWTGSTFHSLHGDEHWHRYNRNRSLYSPPGGESLMGVQSRAWACLSDLSNRHDGDTIAVVSHADVIRASLILLLGMPLDFLLRFEIAPASVTAVNLGGDYPTVSWVNSACSSLDSQNEAAK